MNARVFVDTNVLVYARDASEPGKQARAAEWMRHLWATRRGRVSYQVLQEYFVTVTQKLRPGLAPDLARRDIRSLAAWGPVSTDLAVMEGAWDLQDRRSLSWWDALVVSAARVAGCDVLLTEDLQPGEDFGGLVVVNPFQRAPQ